VDTCWFDRGVVLARDTTKEDLMSAATEAHDWRGHTVVDRDGEKIGKLTEIYLDRETNQPEWALVNTGLLGTKSSFVPLKGAAPAGEEVRVAYAKDQVKDAPSIDVDDELSEQEEAQLYRHYGLEYSEAGSGGGQSEGTTPASGGRPGSGGGQPEGTTPASGGRPGSDDALTRSEEEVRVGTAERERGRARLKKYVETEDVQETVPVRREEARVEREPISDENIDQAMRGPEISEAEHEVTLKEEEPVVEKRTVPKERVRLDKDVETGEEEVSEQVRKERVEVEEDR
jgi:stress response protein YsnF